MNDRRSIGRTRIAKTALLFSSGQAGVRSCGVTDITNTGAGIRLAGLTIPPLNFELSFDNFHTVRRCRLIWRDGDSLGVAFEQQNARPVRTRNDAPGACLQRVAECGAAPFIFTCETAHRLPSENSIK
jgi:hypothetical protein